MRSSCPIACALDLIGDPWTLVVLRDVLLAGRRTFSEFGVAEGIATNTLTERLRRLEAAGVLEVSVDPQDRRRRLYRPTERGLDLIPVVLEVGLWGGTHLDGATAHRALFESLRHDREGTLARLRAAARI